MLKQQAKPNNSQLKSDDEKERYCRALLSRLNRNTEHALVGYLVLYALFQLSKLDDALNDAVKNLQSDKAYGFSDLLRLLDSLLKFRQLSFTPETLDFIENAMGAVEEHTFRIEERLAAIRAYRLSRT